MERKQYIQLIQSNADWLPGKEAIANEIKKHCKASPRFIGMQEINVINTAVNGVFIYKDSKECTRLTTCGLTQIAPNEYAFGQSRSGWGAEFTVALNASNKSKIINYAKLLVHLAHGVNIRKAMYTEYSCVNLNRLKPQEQLAFNDISGIVFIQDMELKSIETLHGSVDFLQIVSVNGGDWDKIRKTHTLVRQYIHELGKVNPYYCIDKMDNLNVFE